MNRVAIIMIICGIGALVEGCREYRLSAGVPTTPIDVSIRDLERGDAPYTTDVRIGKHVAVFSACVASYEMGLMSDLNANTKCTSAYYPAVSSRHRLLGKIKRLMKKYRNRAAPDNPKIAEGDDIAVLVRTLKYKTIGAIPQSNQKRSTLQGMVVNCVHTIDGEERKLLQSAFPHMDLDKILVVEEGRSPQPQRSTSACSLEGCYRSSEAAPCWPCRARRKRCKAMRTRTFEVPRH